MEPDETFKSMEEFMEAAKLSAKDLIRSFDFGPRLLSYDSYLNQQNLEDFWEEFIHYQRGYCYTLDILKVSKLGSGNGMFPLFQVKLSQQDTSAI